MGSLRDLAARLRALDEAAEDAEREAATVAARAAFYARFQAEAAAALAEREPDPIEAAERAAVFGVEAEPNPYQPGDPDPLRDGLLRGWRDHRPAAPIPDGCCCTTCHPAAPGLAFTTTDK